MSEMVDRIAAAMLDAGMGEHCDASALDVCPAKECECRSAASAAIAAMREPTEAMIAARYGPEGLIDEPYCAEDAKTSWQAMIDAALA